MADEFEISVVEVIGDGEVAVVLAPDLAPVSVAVVEAEPVIVVVAETSSPGGGDMFVVNYDSNNDGKVNAADEADHADSADSVPWSGVTDTPSEYPPAAHEHDEFYEPKNSNIQGHIDSTSNPHGTTAAQVGLGNCNNTSDADKPVSTAQQTALDGKVSHSLATAINDFLVASGVGQFVKKTVTEVKAILGLGSAAYTESSAYAASSHPHGAGDITQDSTHRFVTDTENSTWSGKQDALGFTPENSANKGQVSGYASLDETGKVPSGQLPTIASSFTALTDAPSSYTGQGGKSVLVKADATGLEFGTPATGDMLKATYDTNNDGKVNAADAADAVPWSGVTDKPSTFPPETHNHDLSYAAKSAEHTHSNSSTLDKIGESDGDPTWDGGAWPGGGETTSVSLFYYTQLVGGL